MKTRISAALLRSFGRLSACAILLVAGAVAYAMPGSGTEDDPFLISTCQELSDIRNNPSASYKLVSDVDCDVPPFNTGSGFIPIDVFTGHLDGDFHIVDGLYIFNDRPDGQVPPTGLFGWDFDGTVEQLGLENVNVTGKNSVAALVGSTRSNATIRQCWSSGKISGLPSGNIFGGLVGVLAGSSTIEDSYSTATITGSNAGGVVGTLAPSVELPAPQVIRSYASGTIVGAGGGITASTGPGGIIADSFGAVHIIGSGGGLVDWMGDWVTFVVTNSYYDIYRTGGFECIPNRPDMTGCIGVNVDNSTPNYFFDSSNPPMSSWSFPPWIARPGDYPVLRDDNVMKLADVKLSKSIIAGCKSVTGTVTLSKPVPTEGVVVTLSDTLVSANTPSTLKILAGATSRTFTVRTLPVEAEEAGTVSATLGSTTLSQPLTVRPMGLTSVTLTPSTVVGSQPVVGKATLECKAGPGPITVEPSSSNAAVAYPVAANIIVPQGVQSANFDVMTNTVLAKSYATISGTANGITKSKKLTVNVAAAVSPTSLKFGSVTVGTTSAPLTTTLTNKGAAPFAINSIGLTGTAASWFAQTNDCPATLVAGASCSVSVTFTPISAASKSAKLSIATSATATPLSVSLSGTGVLPP